MQFLKKEANTGRFKKVPVKNSIKPPPNAPYACDFRRKQIVVHDSPKRCPKDSNKWQTQARRSCMQLLRRKKRIQAIERPSEELK